jgi:flagellar motility protein MotE (MotC chaperone)
MRFVSDITGKIYPTEKDCLAAEKAFVEEQKKAEAEKKALAEQKKVRQAELDLAYEEINKAKERYNKLKEEYFKDYQVITIPKAVESNIEDLKIINEFINSLFGKF